MKQLTTEQRLDRLVELKAQRDEIDREIAAILGDAPPPRRIRSSVRAGGSEAASQSRPIDSADASPSADPALEGYGGDRPLDGKAPHAHQS